eukprot:2104192-Rhodomonas_salina.3
MSTGETTLVVQIYWRKHMSGTNLLRLRAFAGVRSGQSAPELAAALPCTPPNTAESGSSIAYQYRIW